MKNARKQIVVAVLAIVCFGLFASASAQSVGDKVNTAAVEAKQNVEEAGKAAATKVEELWHRIDEGRLKNRTPDEIIAWLIMGLVVGTILGRATGFRPWTTIVFGLMGAFLGGMVVHLTRLNLGLGPVLIRYEDLIFSLAGGVLVVLVARRFMARKKEEG